MTIRDGRRTVHDHGPTPVASERIPGGQLARPIAPRTPTQQARLDYQAAYHRARRAARRAS